MKERHRLLLVVFGLWLSGGLSALGGPTGEGKEGPAPAGQAAKGELEINVTDVLGHDLQARVELQQQGLPKPILVEVPKGHLQTEVPAGSYKAYVFVYCLKIPVMVDAQDVTIKPGETVFLLTNVLEGTGGSRTLLDFDQDCDFAIDSVEVKCGTNPADPSSVPGREPILVDDRVLVKEERWYRGELHVRSSYGIGKETVARLVKRAEKEGLDFLAVTDRNTMAACRDPGFKSDSVVLIPALEWGSDEKGVALLYGPRTFSDFVDSVPQAQALVDLVQAQGGFFAVAHPCFPTAPWQWGLSYVNGIEVWCREWRAVPPMSLDQLSEDLKERKNGKLVHSIAFAAASPGLSPEAQAVLATNPNADFSLSANGQAAIFYDAELVRGLKAAVIGGSYASSPEVPLGAPVTYVYAKEKSVKGILDGLRRGRTFVSSSLKGPRLHFYADVLKDGSVDVSLGGIIPLRVPTRFEVVVENGKGNEVQVLLNGHSFLSKTIENDSFALNFDHTPENYAVYRVRVVGRPKKAGFGPVDMLAMSSPIYAQDIKINNPKLEAYQKQQRQKKYKEKPSEPSEIRLPADPTPGEIKPKWRF
jgi:hypothetical protein